MKHLITSFVLIVSLASFTASASEAERKPANIADLSLWKIYLYAGGGSSLAIDSVVRSNGLIITSGSASGKIGFPSGVFGIEAEHHAPPAWLGTSLLIQRTALEDSIGDNHSLMTFAGMAKVIRSYNDWKLWAGIGGGLSTLSLGGGTSVVSNGYRVSVEPNGAGLSLLARVGATYQLSESLSMGAFIGRNGFSTSLSGSVIEISTGASAPLEFEYSAGWWDYGIRFGFDF